MPGKIKILIIDDDETSRRGLESIITGLGEDVISLTTNDWHSVKENSADGSSRATIAVVGKCKSIPFNRLLADIYQWESGIPFIVLDSQYDSGLLSPELITRITELRGGELNHQLLSTALRDAKLFKEHDNRLQRVEGESDSNMLHGLVGQSEAIQRVRRIMTQVSNTEVSVLIMGESGTGKEVVARSLHSSSIRSEKPFIPINCGAIPIDLLESELFGHEIGAFTGAISSRAGRFELADGGTLFLDEIGDMPLNMQVKLLRVLQEKSFERIGGDKTIKTDVRIIAATHKDLEKMILKEEFRQDLYYRINVFPIEMPPLRDRSEDIPLLIEELITLMEAEKRGSVRFNSSAISSLCLHPWLGNVRELANLVERMSILHPHGIVGINELPREFQHIEKNSGDKINLVNEEGSGERLNDLKKDFKSDEEEFVERSLLPLTGVDLKEYLANLEKALIEQALDYSGGVVARAADRLRIRRTTLVEKMRKYQLQRKQDDRGYKISKDIFSEKVENSGSEIEPRQLN